MIALVSPYHLTTREPAALAALLLAERAVTLLPVPAAGVSRQAVLEAVRGCPPYARLLMRWRWMAPLFESGVVASLWPARPDLTPGGPPREAGPGGPAPGWDDALDDARRAGARLRGEPAWNALAPFARDDLFEPTPQWLERWSLDLLKGGPDPGIGVPVAAGLDAFAWRHGMTVFRAGASVWPEGVGSASARRGGTRGGGDDRGGGRGEGPSSAGPSSAAGAKAVTLQPSAAQRAEARLGRSVLSVALPVLAQASARTLLTTRAALAGPLADWRQALSGAIDDEARGRGPAGPGASAARHAARVLGQAFESIRPELIGRDDDEGERVLDAYVRLTVRRLPVDAALLAARAALAALRLRQGEGPARSASLSARRAEGGESVEAPSAGEPDGPMVVAVVVEPMNVDPSSMIGAPAAPASAARRADTPGSRP